MPGPRASERLSPSGTRRLRGLLWSFLLVPLGLLVWSARSAAPPSAPLPGRPAAAAADPPPPAAAPAAGKDGVRDIRKLSQHFTDPRGDTWPWVFLPEDNIRRLSTAEHPGMVTLWEAGKGQDVKGVLQDPIALSDYPPPWEFHLGLVQNYLAQKGLSEEQINYAVGLNLALTF